jgi:hypothetical protein
MGDQGDEAFYALNTTDALLIEAIQRSDVAGKGGTP